MINKTDEKISDYFDTASLAARCNGAGKPNRKEG
jgi:hypothetical protein